MPKLTLDKIISHVERWCIPGTTARGVGTLKEYNIKLVKTLEVPDEYIVKLGPNAVIKFTGEPEWDISVSPVRIWIPVVYEGHAGFIEAKHISKRLWRK